MYQIVPDCTRMYQNVPDCARLHQAGVRSDPDRTRLHRMGVRNGDMYQIVHIVPDCIERVTRVSQVESGCTRLYQIGVQSVPDCTRAYQNVPDCTKLYKIVRDGSSLNQNGLDK